MAGDLERYPIDTASISIPNNQFLSQSTTSDPQWRQNLAPIEITFPHTLQIDG
jgi:hypothetical protein